MMRLMSYITNLRCCALAMIVGAAASVSAATGDDTEAPKVLPGVTTLETFRQMALESNKQLMMSRERIRKAEYQKKEAFAAYLPGIDFAGGYVYNQRELSIFDSDQLLPTKTFECL